jgi:predicted acyltransferase
MSMILVNFLAIYPSIPWILKHAPNVGLTFADIVAPLFMFIIGLMYRRSFIKRIKSQGRIKTWIHFSKRYFYLCLLGFVGNWIARGSIVFEWGVLQTIGLAGIIALPFIDTNSSFRLGAGFIILVIYQLLLLPNIKDLVLSMDHGGPFAVISWVTIILLST